MKPGRDLDYLIAEKVMGLEVGWVRFEPYCLAGVDDTHWCPETASGEPAWSKTPHEEVGTKAWGEPLRRHTFFNNGSTRESALTYQKFGYLKPVESWSLLEEPPRVKHYSKDIRAAWEVAQKIKDMYEDHEFEIYLSNSKHKECEVVVRFWMYRNTENEVLAGPFYILGESAPHAICLAALKSVGHEFKRIK